MPLVLLSLIGSTSFAREKCQYNWTDRELGSELTQTEERAFRTFYNDVDSVAYGTVTKVSPDSAKPYTFELEVIHYFKKDYKYPKLTVRAEGKPEHIEKGQLWVLPLFDLKSSTLTTSLDCSFTGFSPKQEAVFFSLQQLAGFSKDLGLDQWLTCSESHECTFVQTCSSCHRVINMVYLPQFSKWKSLSPNSSCKSCVDVEDHAVRFRAVCTEMKICGQEERSP